MSPSGHTSCCQLLSQESRHPGGMRRRPGCPLNPVLAPEPRRAPLFPARFSAICGPPYSDRGQGGDAGFFRPMFSSQTMGTRMFHPASPLTVSPSSPNPRPTALPDLRHPMKNQARADSVGGVPLSLMLIWIPALMNIIIQSLNKHQGRPRIPVSLCSGVRLLQVQSQLTANQCPLPPT